MMSTSEPQTERKGQEEAQGRKRRRGKGRGGEDKDRSRSSLGKTVPHKTNPDVNDAGEVLTPPLDHTV